MAAPIAGRLIGDTTDLTVEVGSTGQRIPLDRSGRFRVEVVEGEPIRLRIRRPGASPLDVEVAPDASAGEVVIVAPEPTTDLRDQAATFADELAAEQDAVRLIRASVRDAIESAEVGEREVAGVVDAVLSSVSAARADSSRWRLDSHASLRAATEAAVDEGQARLARSRLRVNPGAVADGQRLPAAALVEQVTGVDGPELRRRSAADLAARRREATDPDGLPAPQASEGGEDGLGASSSGSTPATVDEKTEALVDAMRLPEDPPLLVSNAAIPGPGASVELSGGPADTTAVHDFHELILAMPSVWAEVFDPEFVAVVETSVRNVLNAGVPASAIVAGSPGSPARPEERLVRWLSAVGSGLAGSQSIRRVQPPPQARSGSMLGLLAGQDRILDDPVQPPPRDPVPPPQPPSGGIGTDHGHDLNEAGVVGADPSRGVGGLLGQLKSLLSGSHSFTVYPADGDRSINFGLLLNWRQRWEPLAYQTGELVHTMTLSPGETRKIVTSTTRRTQRAVKEAESSQRTSSSSVADTIRGESEIIRRAAAKTNFQLASGGSTRLIVQSGKFGTKAGREASNEGGDTRRRFREAVLNAAQELRSEHSMSVSTDSEYTLEEESTAEVANPHKELAMTCLFYSLQRRYRVSERLHKATPVVLVAMRVPARSAITTGWLVRHGWILERCLLAERFRPALTYLTTSFLGDTDTLRQLADAVEEQRKALDAAQHRLRKARSLVEHRSTKLADLRAAIASGDPSSVWDLPGLSLIRDVGDFVGGLFGGGGGNDDQARREREAMLIAAAEDELDRADREARDAVSQVENAAGSYQEAVREHVEAKRNQRNHEVRIAELRLHVADNILHYCQVIWASQHPDQQFFELHDVQVPVLDTDVVATDTGVFAAPGVGGVTPSEFELAFDPATSNVTWKPLAEVADLDELLGFKGNYAMFPLRSQNALTSALLAPYVDGDELLRDPLDEAGNWTVEELRAYADELRQQVSDGALSQQDFDAIHVPFLRATLERLITDPHPSESEVVVPSDSLYAELLTSGTSLIDDYMRASRSLDVAKSRAEIRSQELENLRMALRLEARDLADPDMDEFERHLLRTDPPSP